MTTLTISGSSGDIPDGKAPLSRGLPPEATVGRVDWQSSGPVQVNLRIRGLNHYANYTAPSVAVVDHYDPFLRAAVREYFVIGGGQGASDISFVTGGSADGSVRGMGQAKIAIYSLGGAPLGVPGHKSLGAIGHILSKAGEASRAIKGSTNTVAYSVTDMGGGVIDPNSPGFVESQQRSLSRKVILQQDDYAFAGRGFDTPRELLGTRPTMESWHPKNIDQNVAPPALDDRRDGLFPAATFDQRWAATSDPSLQTARSWLDLSQNPAYGNLNPVPAPSQSPQRQEGRRLQDIGVVEPQGQELPPDLPLPRSALAWMNLENTPLGVLRTAVSPNAPVDVWNDVFAGPAFANNVLPAAPEVAPFEQGPAAPNANMGPMTSLADLGSGYRNAGLGNSSFGNFADYGTGDFGDYGYGGLERYGIPVR